MTEPCQCATCTERPTQVPKYEYKCPGCDRVEMTTKSFGDKLPNCPTLDCNSKPKRVWSANVNIANLKAEH